MDVDNIGVLCVDAFLPLRERLLGMSLQTASRLGVDSVCSIIDPAHRDLFRLFWEGIVAEHPLSVYQRGRIDNCPVESQITFDLSNEVASSSFANVFTEKVNVLDLSAEFADLALDLSKVRCLNLSSNNFVGDDLPHVKSLVQELQDSVRFLFVSLQASPQLSYLLNHVSPKGATQVVIILRFNRLYQCFPQIRELLELPSVQFIDVVGNPMATVSSKEDFSSLDLDLLKKLIFLLPAHSSRRVLEKFVGEEHQKDVEESHSSYYTLHLADRTVRKDALKTLFAKRV